MSESANPSLTVELADEAATGRLMADLAMLLGAGDVVTLSGDLGAGKTAAARALIRYLAGDAGLDVPSPTFTLAQSYDLATFPLLHVDLYRINASSELEELGLAPFPAGTVVLLEWPERAADVLPTDRIDIALSHPPQSGPDARRAVVTGFGAAQAKVARLSALREFLTLSGYLDATRKFMAGDASTRSYARLHRDGVSTILMNSPPRLDQQLIYGGKSYLAAVHLAEEITPFVAVADGLRSCGLSAPAIHHVDLHSGFLISEDFGSIGVVEGNPPAPIAERYQAAIDVLVQLHSEPRHARLPVTGHNDYLVPAFDVEAMLIEVSLLPDWYLPDRDAALTPALRQQFLDLWRALLAPVLDTPETWVIRDYHSPNLIWLPERDGLSRVGIIDFQDTVSGPAAYDVVSLAQDARVDVSESLEIALLSRYVLGRRTAEPDFDAATFATRYALMSAQRNTRLLGVFARLNRRDHNPHYLRHQPRIWSYLQRALAHPALTSLRSWYAANLPPPAAN